MRYIVANFKMQGTDTYFGTLAQQLIASKTTATVVLCPSYPYLASLAAHPIAVGAQDVSAFATGAYTGQVSASMLLSVGCTYVIIGHSERRKYCQESNSEIKQKLSQALASGLKPILCVGEVDADMTSTARQSLLAEQLQVLEGLALDNVLIAYEPVWAIGTGKSADPKYAQMVHQEILALVKAPVLYGGSVNATNAPAFLAQSAVSGLLVGGASLDATAFLSICQIG